MFWQSRPFLRILPFYLSGILIGRNFFPEDYPFSTVFYLLLFTLILSIVFVFFYRPSYRYRWLTAFFLYAGLLEAGLALTLQKKEPLQVPIPHKKTFWEGKVESDPVLKNQTIRFIFEGNPMNISHHNEHSVKLYVFIKAKSIPDVLEKGSRLIFYASPRPVSSPKNPYEFNYRQYLADKGIGYTVFVNARSWKILAIPSPFSLSGFFTQWRKKLLQIIERQNFTSAEKTIAAAILLGKHEMIPPGIYQSFTAAGVVHILCVSGLHVGIIFLIFHFLLRFVVRFKNGENIRRGILILIIWAYAMLTGLSPSITRAATMLTLFIFAEMLNRDYDRFNLLAASAFLLLFIHPLMLFNVGFQLSYAAVGGIFLFYTPFYRLIYFRSPLLRLFWAALAVSFSAQAGAFAIAAHYFHQFPLYFLFANLTVFLLSYFIIIFGLALFLFSPVHFLSEIFAFLLAKSIHLLVLLVQFFAALPHAVVSDIHFPWLTVFGIFLLLIFGYNLLIHKKRRMVIPILMTLLFLEGIHTYFHFQQENQEKLIVYSLPKHTAIDLISGQQHLLLVDTALWSKPSKAEIFLKDARIAMGLPKEMFPISGKDTVTGFADYCSGFGQIGNLRFFIPPPYQKHYPSLRKKVNVEFLICRFPWSTRLKEIQKSIQFRKIILDASLPSWLRTKIVNQAKQLKIKYIDTKSHGALVVSVKKKIIF